MRTAIICHEGADLDREGLARWLASFTTYAGTVVIREPRARLKRRIRREMQRVGPWRFLDVLAFRALYAVGYSSTDAKWERSRLAELRATYPHGADAPDLVVASPNSVEAESFLRERAPDLVIARCKTLLKEQVFAIPRLGTFVMHPGICPEYRNAHGCFWAMASGDYDNVGMTLLRIDRGVDTGPVFGHFHVTPRRGESHVVLQHRAVLDHLDDIKATLLKIEAGDAQRVDTTGRRSAAWGQPWLSAYLRMRFGPRSGPPTMAPARSG